MFKTVDPSKPKSHRESDLGSPCIFIATEVDEGLGHVVPWTGFVAQAIAWGYQVHMAAPDVEVLDLHIGARFPIHLWPSPRIRGATTVRRSSTPSVKSWSELLLSLGYAQSSVLRAAVKAWRSILSQVRPSVILADYAPALILAAKTMDIPLLEVGGGFCVPPLIPAMPFPGIRNDDVTAMAHADAQLASAYSDSLTHFNHPGISAFSETQAWPAARIVLSPPELDPYGMRTDVVYAGLLQPFTKKPELDSSIHWPPVVGYLKGGTPGFEELIDQMERAGIEALIYLPNDGSDHSNRRGTVTLVSSPIDLECALHHASVYLSNGGLSGVGQALQHGCWPVIAPQQAEQISTARNLLLRGWASIWLPQDTCSASSMQTLFASRPRQSRWSTHSHAEATLLKTIEGLIPSHVSPT